MKKNFQLHNQIKGMKIEIKKLSITNFKGIRSMIITFNHITSIFGDNGTGKTTIFDAFLWLLFGKDSTDRKDFEIKTLDENNQPYHELDHEVSALITVDGVELELKKSLREKWVKKRGATTDEFTGHETTYFWNDVPMKQEEYQGKIAGIVNEGLFKLLTNTAYFNSMKWEMRREVLLKLAGNISDADIIAKIAGETDVTLLTKALNANKTIEELKKELVAKKKKINDEKELIPSRISEVNRAIENTPEINAKEIENNIKVAQISISNIDKSLMDKSAAETEYQNQKVAKVREVGAISAQISTIENNIRNSVVARRNDRATAIANEKALRNQKNDEVARVQADINYNESQKANLVQRQNAVRADWHRVNDEKLPPFDDSSCKCPTCQRVFEDVDIAGKKAEFEKNFNADKSKRLQELKDRGVQLGNQIAEIDQKISVLAAKKTDLEKEISILQDRINNLEVEHTRLTNDENNQVATEMISNKEIKSLSAKKDQLEVEINAPAPVADEEQKQMLIRKQQLNSDIAAMQQQLGSAGNREKLESRLKELSESESRMAQELADLEQSEHSIDLFTRAKMDELAARVNGKFSYVTFKLFEQQINGGEKPCCETLINGVPYSDANTASRINAGIDIINTLSQHYNVTAPIFIDNRESVIKLLPTDSQIVNLIVSAAHKKLTVSAPEMAMAV
ncbi:MAG: AAA family ATPase [Agriterribacter sp.]